MNEPDRNSTDLMERLRNVQPARSALNARETFYRSGYEACRVQMRARHARQITLAMAATALAILITGPAGYFTGRHIAGNTTPSPIAPTTLSIEPSRSLEVPEDAVPAERGAGEKEPTPEPIPPSSKEAISLASQLLAELRAREQQPATLLANWMNPLVGIAESTKLDRQTQQTLTMSHSSRLLLESSVLDLRNLALASNDSESRNTTGGNTTSDAASGVDQQDDEASRPMLSVKDFKMIAFGMETAR